MMNSTKVTRAKVTASQLRTAKCSMTLVYKRLKEGWELEKALGTPPDSPHEILRQRYEQERSLCPVCGKRCSHKRDKYCCKEHFWLTRRKDGTFSKGVQSSVKKSEKT